MQVAKTDLTIIQEVEGRIVVAYSGGIDSHVLLHWLCQLNLSSSIHALHIHHGLSEYADQWQIHCATQCEQLGVEMSAIHVNVSRKGSLEAAARDARYQAFAQFIEAEDLLLLGHHQDDQLESILLHLLRGDSPFGVQGMSKSRKVGSAELLRPFLGVGRDEIEIYAESQSLHWIEDDSNQNIDMDRNFLRQQIFPRLKQRWPQMSKTWVNALEQSTDGLAVIEAMAETDLQNVTIHAGRLSVKRLSALSKVRQVNLFRLWFKQAGIVKYPSRKMLSTAIANLLFAKKDAEPNLTWQGKQIHRFADSLFLLDEWQEESMSEWVFGGESPILQDRLANGQISANLSPGGLRVSGRLTVRFRKGGEKMLFEHNRSLKNIFQESHFPAFLRDYVPLLYLDDELVAICGIEMWQIPFIVIPKAQSDESGWVFQWKVPAPW